MTKKLSFGERFRKWRTDHQFSAYAIAQRTGINPSFISNIEASRRPMSKALMAKIAEIPEYNLTLETLQRWKLDAEYPDIAVEENTGTPHSTLTPLDGLYRIPLKMTVSAGALEPKNQITEPVYIDWYSLTTLSTDLFCIRVQGNSMWPPIPDGALLLVRETDSLKSAEKYVVETDEENMTFKLIEFDKNGAYLVPLNPDYPKVSLADAKLKKIYQVLSYKVDWS